MPDNRDFINKFSVTDWKEHSSTIIMIIAVNAIWILIFIIVSMGKGKANECMEQVSYLRDRLEKVEGQIDSYTTTIMYKDAQVKNRDHVIDSLRRSMDKKIGMK